MNRLPYSGDPDGVTSDVANSLFSIPVLRPAYIEQIHLPLLLTSSLLESGFFEHLITSVTSLEVYEHKAGRTCARFGNEW